MCSRRPHNVAYNKKNKNMSTTMSKVFFTSDLHFDHSNIIKYCNRPFRDADHMNAVLVDNWNSVVTPQDTVWVLGDFTMGSEAQKFLRRLNGNKFLVEGNHDRQPSTKDGWAGVFPFKEIKVEGQKIVLCHYAMRVWNKSHRGSWMLYGHSHNTLPDDPTLLSIDVGVDCHNYFPISYEEIGRIMARKTPKPVDHHGKDGL